MGQAGREWDRQSVRQTDGKSVRDEWRCDVGALDDDVLFHARDFETTTRAATAVAIAV